MTALGVNVAVLLDGKILLMQREDFEVWCLPGGGLEPGETLAQAAVREAREETGLDVELTRLVGVYSRPGEAAWGGHIVLFAARPVGGSLQPQPEEAVDLRFFAPDALPHDLVVWHRRRILDVLENVGGGVARFHDRPWPFGPEVTRGNLYQVRDRSGLSRQEFYLRRMASRRQGTDILEVPGGQVQPPIEVDAGRLDGARPQTAVNIAVIRDGRILLTRREDFEVWCLPGGGVEPDETLAQAARREALEETGLEVALTRLVGVYSDPRWFYGGLHIACFAARPLGDRLAPDPAEVIQTGYFGPLDLPEPMLVGNRQRALDALEGLGGGRAWRQEIIWPFEESLTRQQLYELRDRSALPRAEFYRRHFGAPGLDSGVAGPGASGIGIPGAETLEVSDYGA